MKIFSAHRKKLEPRRRFGGLKFRGQVRQAANYKRVFNPNPTPWLATLAKLVRGHRSFWRNIGTAAILVLFYYLVISSHFVVTQIEVTGNLAVSSEYISNVIAHAGESRTLLIKRNNYFLLTGGRVSGMLKTAIPEIKSVQTNRDWPNKIKIEITEHNPSFVIESNGNFFLVDDEGVIVKQIDSPGELMVAHDQLTENFAQGEGLNTKLAPFVISMLKQWPNKINVAIAAIKFPGKESTDVEFATSASWSVLFDTTRAVVSQLDGLAIILAQQISVKDQARLSYIDLRSNKWAYYCFKSTPCSQVAQPAQ